MMSSPLQIDRLYYTSPNFIIVTFSVVILASVSVFIIFVFTFGLVICTDILCTGSYLVSVGKDRKCGERFWICVLYCEQKMLTWFTLLVSYRHGRYYDQLLLVCRLYLNLDNNDSHAAENPI